MEVICFSGPLYWALRDPNRGLAAEVTLVSVALGAVFYYYLASTADLRNGLVLGIIGTVLQGLLFLKARQTQGA